MQFQAILRKYKFTLAHQERGRVVYRFYIDQQPPFTAFHQVQIWPNGTWEVHHYKFGRCYFANFNDAESLDKFLFNRFPELRAN